VSIMRAVASCGRCKGFGVQEERDPGAYKGPGVGAPGPLVRLGKGGLESGGAGAGSRCQKNVVNDLAPHFMVVALLLS
jgi:hypothetical protein